MAIETTWNRPVYLFAGTYEQELHWIWNEIEPTQGMRIWVIGAAEGYYACGMAKKWGARVTAYESSEDSQRILKRNIALNDLTGTVTPLGKCEVEELASKIREEAPHLLLCDIEGGEDEMFSEDVLQFLSKTTLVIEMHPPYGSRAIAIPLAKTHHVHVVNPVGRCLTDYPYRDWIPNAIKLDWLNEGRPFPTPWLVALPRT